ncbi:MAG: GNAT family N-acetyltransferase [bacterium]|nr:GNAT family N-acetyltransferase [bacterium]
MGRISAQVDYDFVDKKTGFIGFFECIDDEAIANELFSTAESFLKEKGVERVIGPMSPSSHYTIGLLVEGFDEYPYIDMPYNMPYYEKLFIKNGYKKEMDLLSYYYQIKNKDIEKINKLSNFAKEKYKVSVRNINMKDFENEMEILRTIYNDAWSENFGFTKISKEEFLYITNELKSIAIPELVLVASIDLKPAGFIAAIPDYNLILRHLKGKLGIKGVFYFLIYKKRIKSARVITMGVSKEFRKKGVDATLIAELLKNGVKLGITKGELSWVLETNTDIRSIIEKFGAKISKRYRLFSKNI